MQKARKGLGRGLSALIPEADIDFLTRVARGESAQTNQGELNSERETQRTATRPSSKPTKRASKKVGASSANQATRSQVSISSSPDMAHQGDVQSALSSLAEMIPLSQIEANPYQPRRTFSDVEMQELSDSIRQHGVLQPILLRPVPDSMAAGASNKSSTELKSKRAISPVQYQLIAGERRWRASQKAGLKNIPAIIRLVTDQQALELAVIENVQRHDISALDAATAYRRLSQEFSLSQEEIAQRVGKSRVSISNTIRLLDLPSEVQNSITDGSITEGHGRAILLANSDGARRAVFRRLIRDKLSVRATEEFARKAGVGDIEGTERQDESEELLNDAKNKIQSPPEIRRIEEGLQKILGTRVRLRPRKRGGQVIIQYFSNEELERLLKVMLRH